MPSNRVTPLRLIQFFISQSFPSIQCNHASLATQTAIKARLTVIRRAELARGAPRRRQTFFRAGHCRRRRNTSFVMLRIALPSCIHYSGVDTDNRFVVERVMTILQRTCRYVFVVSVLMSLMQVTVVAAQNKKDGVTVSYESSGSSRVARFKNSNAYHVRVEFSYNGTKVHGSAEASGQDAVFVPANYSATYGGHGISISSVRITRVMRSD